MKKRLVALWLVVLIFPSCVTAAYANEGYALSNQNFMPEHIYGLLSLKFQIAGEKKPVFILDHDPTQGNVEYVSWLPYDTLAEISLGWKTASVIVFNTTMNAYFLRVSYVPTISTDGQLEYCALGTSNGYCYGSRATEKGDTNIDNSVTVNKTTVVHNRVISTIVGTASKTVSDVTSGMKNIIDWLSLEVKATTLVAEHLDLTNDLLYWIADNFQDMLYAIGQINLLNAEIGIGQWKELTRIEDLLSAINYNQVYSYYAQGQFFSDIYSSVTGLATRLDTLITSSADIDSRLDSIINNGAVQVNTSSIDARLDKLISMYSKVNSVVLDTASLSGSRINDAVGGELRDVMFWGQSRYADIYTFGYADPLTYTLNGVQEPVIDRPLRGMVLGASIPSSINTSNDVIQAGIWKRSDGKYIISDTYNAATGEYVQRVRSTAYDGSEKWGMAEKTDGVNLFYHKDKAFENVNANNYCQSSWQEFKYREYAKGFNGSANEASAYKNKFTVLNTSVRFVVDAQTFPTLESWTSWLSHMASLGNPLTVWFIPSIDPELGLDYSDGPTVSMLDRTTVTVPEGNSTISSACVRITGKYETYDSYTQTADIIEAINNKPIYNDYDLLTAITNLETILSKPAASVTVDLTDVTSRLDTLISQSSDSVVNVVNNNTYITSVYQLDDENDVADRSKEGIEKIGGVFKWLWKVAFKDAFGAADVTKLDGLL